MGTAGCVVHVDVHNVGAHLVCYSQQDIPWLPLGYTPYNTQPHGYHLATPQYNTQPHGYHLATPQYNTQPLGYHLATPQYNTQPHGYTPM